MPGCGILRPPGACAEREFVSRCVQCGQCAEVCPHGSVRMRGGWGRARHTPEVRPEKTPCYLCMKCPPVCPTGALNPDVRAMLDAGMGTAVILQDKCHNYTGGVMCWTCYDRCPLRGVAIVLHGGLTPAVTEACVGCGICEYVCPVKAVQTLPTGVGAPRGAVPTLPTPKRGEGA